MASRNKAQRSRRRPAARPSAGEPRMPQEPLAASSVAPEAAAPPAPAEAPGSQGSRLGGAAEGAARYDAPLTGPAVLLRRPGQLLLSFAVCLVVGMMAQQSLGFAGEDPFTRIHTMLFPAVDPAAGPPALSDKVTRALERSGIEEESPGSGGPIAASEDTSRGLVGLWKQVAPEAAPPATAPAEAPLSPPAEAPPAGDDVEPILDPSGNAMRRFYDALHRTEQKQPGAVTRVIHFGDSTIVADLVTGTTRRKLQERFGDAGHGFLLIGKPWDWYIHQNVKHSASDAWKLNRITFNPIKDSRHGLGGVNARTSGPGAWASFQTMDEGTTGRNLSRLQILYRAQPAGGKLAIEVDGVQQATLDTAGPEADLVSTTSFPDGPHKLRIRSEGGGEVRLYGVALEREAPGVVYDSIGISGIRARIMARSDAEHFKAQLRARKPDLVILNMGTNESEFEGMNMEEYAQDLTALVRRVRQGVPEASCLLAAPPDRAQKDDRGRLTTTPLIPKIVEVQRAVAAREGCAFWNTFDAMGGKDSMVAWFKHKPRLGSGDYTHFTAAGGEALGLLLYDSLLDGYKKRR